MAELPQGALVCPSDPSVARETFVGGSEAFELLNRTHYRRGCARALAYRKLNTPEDSPPDNAKGQAVAMRAAILQRGQFLEDLGAKLYIKATSRTLIRRHALVRNPDHPGAGVHTDRLILAAGGKPTGDLEIKSHNQGPFLNILRKGLPDAHNLQLQWSLFCTRHTWGAFVMIGVFDEMPIRHFDRDRDEELMEIFARAVDEFWNTLARGELPPQLPDASDIRCKVCPYRLKCRGEMLDPQDYQRLIDERHGRKTLKPIFNDDLDQALADRALILSEKEGLDHASEEDPGALQLINQRILEMIGDEEAMVVNKHWKLYCYPSTYSGVDVQRLKEEQPEIYQRYFIDRKPTGRRTIRVYSMHDGKVA